MRVVFFGTPDFAVTTLDAIYNAHHKVVGVVTVPDKPAGRGLKMQSSEVKNYAEEKGIPLLQPLKLKDPEFIADLKKWDADIFVVVAFRMLPAQVYEIPPKGAFNVHASLLPHYRGAAPIHWAIMNGETQTGVTTFFLNHQIDCGDLLLQHKTEIFPHETTGELYDRLIVMGAALALETLSLVEKGDFIPLPQQHETTHLKVAPKIQKEDTIIDWNDTAKNIINKIRGLSPYPGAITFFTKNDAEKLFVKIFDATILPEKSHHRAGVITTDDKTFLHISTKDFQISIDNLQVEGKKRVNAPAFLQGNKASIYTIL